MASHRKHHRTAPRPQRARKDLLIAMAERQDRLAADKAMELSTWGRWALGQGYNHQAAALLRESGHQWRQSHRATLAAGKLRGWND